MNYFELFGIPVSIRVDSSLLKKKYDEITHQPEINANASEGEHPGMPETSEIHKAYKTLLDEDATIKYILKLKGLLTADEKFEPEPQFGMEVMDINEELMELELDENKEQLMNVEQKTNRLLLKIYEDVEPVIQNYTEGVTTEEELLQVKDFYFQKKYLQRILDRIRGIRNIASPSKSDS